MTAIPWLAGRRAFEILIVAKATDLIVFRLQSTFRVSNHPLYFCNDRLIRLAVSRRAHGNRMMHASLTLFPFLSKLQPTTSLSAASSSSSSSSSFPPKKTKKNHNRRTASAFCRRYTSLKRGDFFLPEVSSSVAEEDDWATHTHLHPARTNHEPITNRGSVSLTLLIRR